MADITNVGGPKNAGPKPRLSLLSAKQSTRLKSEDSPPDQPTLRNNTPQNSMYQAEQNGDQNAGTSSVQICDDSASDEFSFARRSDLGSTSNNARGRLTAALEMRPNEAGLKHPPPLNGPAAGDSNQADVEKAAVNRDDLIRLLSMMKSELQSKEIAIASMKLEQLKRLMNPVEISRSALASTYIDLQDRLKASDRGSDPNTTNSSSVSSAFDVDPARGGAAKHDAASLVKQKDDQDDENLTLLSTLLELLDRHPLLALPRDSLYCLDYTCNELSTKNYLNLKIQHLENLIEQHRRFRFFIGERLKRSEQRYLDLTLKLEREKNLREETERYAYKNEGRTLLLKRIDQTKEALEKEKASKHAIVMTLLNELLDERERNEELSQRVAELEGKLADNNGKSKPTQVKQQPQQQHSSPTTGQQAICKPRVPAKPAQLLDRKLSQTSNK